LFTNSPLDVTERNADPTGQGVGSQLIVDPTHVYADLDELIVNHVQATARRVEELMAHEKYKHGTEDDLRELCIDIDEEFSHLSFVVDLFLKNFVAANPAKSMYGFTLNRKKPGHFCLCFLANKNSTVQTWVGGFSLAGILTEFSTACSRDSGSILPL
jgi:transcription elongation factor SPT6